MNRIVTACVAATCLSASLTSALAQSVAQRRESAGSWQLDYASTVFPSCSTSRTATVALQDDTGTASDRFIDNPCGASLDAQFSTTASGQLLTSPWLKNEFRMTGSAPSGDDVVVFTVDASGSGRVRRTLGSWLLADLRLISTISGEAAGTVVFQGPIESPPGTPQILMVASGGGTQTLSQTLLWPGTYELIVSGEAFRQGSVGSFITIIGAEVRFDALTEVDIPLSGSRIVDVDGNGSLNFRDLGQWLSNPVDLNGDGDVNAEDRNWLEYWLWLWGVMVDDCDQDGIPDRWQIEQDPSLDGDGDSYLDSCNAVVDWRLEPAVRYFRDPSPINDRYGDGIDLVDGRAFVGAPNTFAPTGFAPFRGVVYAFDINDDATTVELPTLFGSANFGNFGATVWGDGRRIATGLSRQDFGDASVGVFALDDQALTWMPELLIPFRIQGSGSTQTLQQDRFILDSGRMGAIYQRSVSSGGERYDIHWYTRSGSQWSFQSSVPIGSREIFNDPRTVGRWSRDGTQISLTSTLDRGLRFSRLQSDLSPMDLPPSPGTLIVGDLQLLVSTSDAVGGVRSIATYSRTTLGNVLQDFRGSIPGGDAAIAFAAGRYFVGDNDRDRVYVYRFPNERGRIELERVLIPPADGRPSNGFGSRIVSDGRYVAISAPDGGLLPSGLQAGGSVLLYDTQRVSVCEGDVNDDGLINFADLNAILADFGMASPHLPGDVDDDGDVDFVDLNRVLSAFGTACN